MPTLKSMNRLEDSVFAVSTILVFVLLASLGTGLAVTICYCTKHFCFLCVGRRKGACVNIVRCRVEDDTVDNNWFVAFIDKDQFTEQHVTFNRADQANIEHHNKTVASQPGVLSFQVKRPHPPFTLYENNTNKVHFFASASLPTQKPIGNKSKRFTNLVVSKNCNSCTLVVRSGLLKVPASFLP